MSTRSLTKHFHAKSRTKRILIFVILHFVVSMLALLAALEGLAAFDVPDHQPSWREGVGDFLFTGLMLPAIALKMLFSSFGIYINDFFEWVFVIVNSIAYALFLDYLIRKLLGRRAKNIPFSKDAA